MTESNIVWQDVANPPPTFPCRDDSQFAGYISDSLLLKDHIGRICSGCFISNGSQREFLTDFNTTNSKSIPWNITGWCYLYNVRNTP
jgi:hypothetical protein